MVGKNDVETIRQARKMAGKARWEAISRTISPFYDVRPIPTLPSQARAIAKLWTILKWMVVMMVTVGVILYAVAGGR
jgi:hypothetical protein